MKEFDLSSSCILIVDDQQANVDLLLQILDMQGYRNLIITTDPRKVISIYATHHPDLVLLDLHMPYLTGIEVIEQLRGLTSADSFLPILVLTADITAEAKRQALHVGANDFLSKPFDMVEVLLRVRNLLETRFLHLQVQNHNRLLEEKVRERTSELVAAQRELMCKNDELSLALVKASEASQLKSQFLANINHEIRTPINGILGMINLLSESGLNEEQREYTDMLKSSGDWLVKLMNDILDVSELGTGKVRIVPRSFDLSLLLKEISTVYRSRAHAKGLKFIAEFTDIPHHVRGDPARLRQVLDHLLSNAVKFTENGRVCLRAEIVHQSSDDLAIKFTVEDTGIGITEEQRRRLFEVFVQGDGSPTRKFGGTGIGLALSKQLVELLGGDIGVDNLQEGGTRAWFTTVLEKPSRGEVLKPEVSVSNAFPQP